jgi:hypothetical protein
MTIRGHHGLLFGGGGGGSGFPLSGLISYWDFEDGSGTNATDSYGANDGTLVNGPTWSTDEKIGTYGVDFSGATNHRVTIPITLDISAQSCTFGCWVKRTGASDNRVVLGWTQGARYWLLIDRSSHGGLTMQIDNGGGGGASFITTGIPLTNGTYFLVGVTFDLAGTTQQIWIDAVEEANNFSGALGGGSGSLEIGNAAIGSLGWDGVIDEAFYFDRVLTLSEWQDIYNAGAGLRP